MLPVTGTVTKNKDIIRLESRPGEAFMENGISQKVNLSGKNHALFYTVSVENKMKKAVQLLNSLFHYKVKYLLLQSRS